MEVIATKTGFDGKRVRTEGEKFEMPEGSKASWFVKADAEKQSRSKKSEAEKPADDLV